MSLIATTSSFEAAEESLEHSRRQDVHDNAIGRRPAWIANTLRGIGQDEPFALSAAAFFAHFATADSLGYQVDDRASNGQIDPLGAELLARSPAYATSIGRQGVIPLVASYLNWLELNVDSVRVALLPDPTTRLDGPKTPAIPQSPPRVHVTSRWGTEVSRPEYGRLSPHPVHLYSWASTFMLRGFNLAEAVKGDNAAHIATDRPVLPESTIASSSEFVVGLMCLSSLWYYYASPVSFEPVVGHWCSWLNDRIAGARAPPIPLPPFAVADRALHDTNTEHDIMANAWSLSSRAIGSLEPVPYRASFAEFYSMMALRNGLPLQCCDGTSSTDLLVMMQIVAQVPTLLYDAMSGDHRGAAFFTNGKMGRALARRFVASLRWYIQCCPSAAALAIIPAGLYAYASKRHGPGYWEYVRLRLLQRRVRIDWPACCVPTFWNGNECPSLGDPDVQPCSHVPRPTYDSPVSDLIDAVSSVAEYETYGEWRHRVDTAVARIDGWARSLATSKRGDVFLVGFAASASQFLNLISDTLAVVLDLD